MISRWFNAFLFRFLMFSFFPQRPPQGEGGFSAGGSVAGAGASAAGGASHVASSHLGRRAPRGWFHRPAQQEEEELVTKGLVKQFFLITIPAGATGLQNPINVSGNGLQMLRAMALGNPPAIVNGSTTARISVRINNEAAPWIPMSFIGANNDAQYIAASIGKIWVMVHTSDAANPVFLIVTNNAGISTPDSDSASSYSVPAGAQGPV